MIDVQQVVFGIYMSCVFLIPMLLFFLYTLSNKCKVDESAGYQEGGAAVHNVFMDKKLCTYVPYHTEDNEEDCEHEHSRSEDDTDHAPQLPTRTFKGTASAKWRTRHKKEQ